MEDLKKKLAEAQVGIDDEMSRIPPASDAIKVKPTERPEPLSKTEQDVERLRLQKRAALRQAKISISRARASLELADAS